MINIPNLYILKKTWWVKLLWPCNSVDNFKIKQQSNQGEDKYFKHTIIIIIITIKLIQLKKDKIEVNSR